jgi:uncharacterized protein
MSATLSRRSALPALSTLAFVCFTVGITGCSDSSTALTGTTELDGPAVTVGNGTARTVVIKRGDVITSIGIRLTDGALTGLPATMPMTEWALSLPTGITALAPWDHMTLDWNPQGHPPPMVYTVPHFDFHFYMISAAAQMAIQGGSDTTPVAAANIPRDYVSQVESVPMMGVHWADTLASEYHGQPFDHTFIYGFHSGKMAFVEPMVTQAFLQSGANFSGPVKQPAAFQRAGTYPTHYSVRHDVNAQTVTISLDSLTAQG